MTRQEANRKILELIAAEVEKYPDLRLNQILCNLDFPNANNNVDYYEDPQITLNRILGE